MSRAERGLPIENRKTAPDHPAKIENSPVRCSWSLSDPLMTRYHDEEWGAPVHDERLLFEFLILEGAQAGLSWLTILKRRESYREAFAGFHPEAVARFGPRQIAALMKNPGIIRNRLKIESAIKNAKAYLGVQDQFGGFAPYQWSFVNGQPIVNRPRRGDPLPATSPESDAMSKALKKRGFSFVGSTICYAHMQATGMVNDHARECFCAARENPVG
jgi:DNA-3-methyladenine glycosylase I